MTNLRPFRFGVINETTMPVAAWLKHVQRVEALGYSTFLIRDHFTPDFFGEQLAPLIALTAAAAVTTRLRLGTLVIDNDYRHPVMLAKEAATLDWLSGGRLELGLGAGWLQREYDAAGMPYERAALRIDRLEEAITVLKGLFAGEPFSHVGTHYRIDQLDIYPTPSQRPHPPLLIGGGKRRVLTLAGREADIVSILTTSVATGTVLDDPRERTCASVRQKLDWVRAGAGDRFARIELSLIPSLIVTDEPRRRASELIAERQWNGVSIDDVLAMPSFLIGSIDEILERLRRCRDEFGFSYYVVSDEITEQFAPIVAALAGE
ncbi:MAG TPA: TIGR03621 family F420-dependent LLM class oxidoreductase [Nitrolancea sp.]|nr:TIGR03621 family F420-dependent LLM class oxidoreductase [Nitrolancea sp.]